MDEEDKGTDVAQEKEGGDLDNDQTVSKSELLRVIDQRQSLKSKLREYEVKFAEIEAAKQEAEEARMREAGEHEKIIASRDAKLSETQEELEQLRWGIRFNQTVAAVSTKAGVEPALVEALLLREQRASGMDVALEDLTDSAVTDLAKALHRAAPSLFETKGKGGSPSTPGLNMANKKAGEETMDAEKARIVALAQQFSFNKGR